MLEPNEYIDLEQLLQQFILKKYKEINSESEIKKFIIEILSFYG